MKYEYVYNHPNMIINICEVCGKEFETSRPAKYCGEDCKKEARNRRVTPKVSKVCPICGTKFKGTSRDKYCSDECSYEAKLIRYRSATTRHTECMEMFNESYATMIYRALKRARGKSELSGVKSDDLVVHHLNGYHWDLAGRCDLANVIVLTHDEHQHFHSIYGNNFNTVEQFEEFIKMY